MKKTGLLFCISFISLMMTACLNDDDIPKQVNETEVISDVTLVFTDAEDHQQTVTYTDPKYRTEDYEDPLITLETGKTYDVSVHFYNKSNPDDVEDVTEEVIDERDDHFVEYRFYGADVDLTRTDTAESTDSNGVKIGLLTRWAPEGAAEGAVRITLIHKPKTKVTNPAEGDHTGGETDAQVEFDLLVE